MQNVQKISKKKTIFFVCFPLTQSLAPTFLPVHQHPSLHAVVHSEHVFQFRVTCAAIECCDECIDTITHTDAQRLVKHD